MASRNANQVQSDSNDFDFDVPWSHCIFVTISTITLPVYVLLLIVICRRRQMTPFYILLLSEGTADIIFIVCYCSMSSFKSLHVYDDFVWRNRDFVATALFLSVYLLTYVRCVGIALISLQRYITICMSGRRIGKILEEVPAIVYAVIHWLVGFLLTTPLLKSLKATILDRVTLESVVPSDQISLANMIAMISIIILFSVSAISYFFVVRNVLKNQFLRDGTRRQEIRLCIQVAGLLLAFLLLFTYSVGQYILIRKNMMTVLRCWRLSNPLVSGFASWILPWMTLATNTQLRDAFSDMVLCRRERRNTIIMSSAKTSRAQ